MKNMILAALAVLSLTAAIAPAANAQYNGHRPNPYNGSAEANR
jgi:hypothetical protein